MSEYAEFLARKRLTANAEGIEVEPSAVNQQLFPFQRAIVRWALRKGRAAIFADTGLGKTFMQLEWARLLGVRTLIVAPLSVARQTATEARKLGLTVHYSRDGGDLTDGINVTNYELIDRFDPRDFGAVVLDESSILKALDGKTRGRLTAMFRETPYRLCCTATPAPNDIAELGNHAEFLGIMTHAEMLAAFFTHVSDTSRRQGWRLKGHARRPFFRWLASWAMSVRRPSDIGFSDDGYVLPELRIAPRWVESGYRPEGMLFPVGLHGLQGRLAARRGTLADRVQAAADLVLADTEPWILWCGLNDEAELAASLIPNAVNLHGGMSPEEKLAAIEAFQDGTVRVLITKPRIAGFGMNFQHCRKMAFVGLGDSFEQYYQCVRRCWRYGQERPVEVHIVLSAQEAEVYENVVRKEREAMAMAEELIAEVRGYEADELHGTDAVQPYEVATVKGEGYTLMLGDAVERLQEVPDESIDLSVFSPPFLSLYTYSPSDRDLGNARSEEEFYEHFGYVIAELLRVTKPGRNACVHVSQVPATKVHDGYIGVRDFRGGVIQAFRAAGWIYHGEVCIDKDPQAQAIRTKSKGLLFVQMDRDSSWLRPALADYILIFRKPGENAVPIVPEMTREEWIQWARPVWYGIRESDTLNAAEARESDDERHVAPLQLGTIERCVRLWSNRGETVLSPFAGIGSEGYVSVRWGRRFVGIELKPSYFRAAIRNLERARELSTGQLPLPMEMA